MPTDPNSPTITNDALDFAWHSASLECKFTGDELPKDTLSRAEQAKFLTSYLMTHRDDSYVLNLNSEWGAGKTYFLKRWANTLREKYPVVYIDAWANDFHNEPLYLILGEVITALCDLKKDNEKEKLKKSLTKASIDVVKSVTPVIAKGLVKKLTGTDIDKLFDGSDEEQNSSASPPQSQPTSNETGKNDEAKSPNNDISPDMSQKATEALLKLHVEQQDSVKTLKAQIKHVLENITSQENSDDILRQAPLFVFVDELDRCRPTFAVEMLEMVKHIFSIPQVIFVIATDTTQLQHSIKALYGSGFDSERYLNRFFNRSFTLNNPDLKAYVATQPAAQTITNRLIDTNALNIVEWEEATAQQFMACVFESLALDLRTINQVLERVSGICAHYPEEEGILIVLLLEAIRAFSQESYDRIVEGRIRNSEHDKITELFLTKLNRQYQNLSIDTHDPWPLIKKNKRWNPIIYENLYMHPKKRISVTSPVHFDSYPNSMKQIIQQLLAIFGKLPMTQQDQVSYLTAYLHALRRNDNQRFHRYIMTASNLS
ncbi:hypothetical protein KIH87_08575 [Paraneptunicella aestuarii]|uniref:KAP family P-loop NTPase fold protein n=1 Tax=Paraneptunicella aestuarii TaxID=2831148 RepID=UPI001E5B31D4|nr:P-loop NTPase fold protein [Paraneptunicella aestuarii]UAA40372.1 hypothetical protein KIH87_08575 [Paraneptunicella aestuarii]